MLYEIPAERDIDESADDVSDAELLACLLKQGDSPREARSRASELLDLAGGTGGLSTLGHRQLQATGLNDETIQRVRAAVRLGSRVAAARLPLLPMNAQAVSAMYRPLLKHLMHEELHMVLMDAAGRYRGKRRLSSGGVAACTVLVKDVLAPAVEAKAAAIVLVHNHPSGMSTPSAEDFVLSQRVSVAAEIVGVFLVDHVVVADDGYATAMPGGGRWAQLNRPRTRVA